MALTSGTKPARSSLRTKARRRIGPRTTYNAAVRAAVPEDRLVDWRPGDGWAPLCAALDLPVPDVPFPHANSTADFRVMVGLDPLVE